MNMDLLECKNRAKELVNSDTPPCNVNGRKKGYIEVMKQLWDEKGYEHLGIRSQNLRDQASRLEKLELGKESGKSQEKGATGCDRERDDLNPSENQENLIKTTSQQESKPENQNNASQNANSELRSLMEPRYANPSITSNQDLHVFTAWQQIPGGSPEQTTEQQSLTIQQSKDNCQAPGCIPDFVSACRPETIKWGKRSDGSEIVLQTSVITDAYNEIVTRKKNVFLVPYGRIGRDFIDQITSHINDWNNGADCQHISLKAAFVLLSVGLQKPSPKSKAKEHQDLLSKRLVQWKDGEINKLLRVGRIIQSRIGKLRSSDPPDKSKVFAKLLLEGQINSALRFLSESTSGGVLPLTDEVMAQLQIKHPEPQPAKLGSLLFGPIDDEFPESVYLGINGEMVRQAALRTKGSGGPCGVGANGFRQMLVRKSFKQSSTKLCEAIAIMTKTLCIQ